MRTGLNVRTSSLTFTDDLLTSLQAESAAQIAGSLSDYSKLRQKFIDGQVKKKYDAMLHREYYTSTFIISPRERVREVQSDRVLTR